jgi:hypothetical protein
MYIREHTIYMDGFKYTEVYIYMYYFGKLVALDKEGDDKSIYMQIQICKYICI